ncbi:MAG: SulP family inorganic anion transporter, partial [Marivivens sp.]
MRRPAILDTLPATTRASLTADALSGLTVAMVAIPLSLAIAIASGADPATGLI